MKSSLCVFAVDFDEGVPAALDDVRQLGVDGVALAVAYHAARDILPRNRRTRVHSSPPGVSFHSDSRRYPPRLRPHPLLPACDGRDLLAEVVAACAERAMVADAWAVYFHRDDEPRDAVSQSYVRNAYGDVYPVALCPAAPDSRRYAEELTAEISRYGARVLLAEAMHFLPLAHGAHHERYFGRLAPLAQFLLSLCFCEHCVGAAESVGVDAARLGSWVRGVVDDPPRVDSHRLVGVAEELAASALAADDLRRFLDLREQHVRLVVERSAAVAARHDVQFCFVDPSPALASRPRGVDRATCLDDCSRELGVRLSEIANVCRVVPALYATEVEAFADDLDATDLRIGTRPRAVLLRPMPPDCDALPNLRAKIGLLEKRGVEDVFYYHYGLMDHRDTARLRAAHGR